MNGPNNYQHIERKYVFADPHKETVLAWLDGCCIHDHDYNSGIISTLYYDTPSLALYAEKFNGDFLKSKVRLRWYSDLESVENDADVKCFLEIKRKYSTVCRKERLEIAIPAGKLLLDPFSDDDILNLPSRVYKLGYIPPGNLVPTLLIRYFRHRFIDPQSHSRIAVDTDIRCIRVNENYFPAVVPVYLSVGVLEIKGKKRENLAFLKPVEHYLAAAAFSKYAYCFENLMQPLGRRN